MKSFIANITLIILLPFVLICQNQKETPMTIKLKSKDFKDGGMMPKQLTCDGKNISPQLSWNDVPEGTQSFALICDDPDAPVGTWVHWVIFNIPANIRELQEAFPTQKDFPNGIKQGINDFRKIGYGGPCPPSGTHRYFFKIYALDIVLELSAGATKQELLHAMENHILAKGELIGRYKR
jgi:Raf kinase inhibitor-like YbhB/YbcL family protein